MVVFGGITIIIGVKNYTVVAWNQRGCGSTYYNYKNKDNDLYKDMIRKFLSRHRKIWMPWPILFVTDFNRKM